MTFIIQGKTLTPDCINVVRAILCDAILGHTKMTNHQSRQPNSMDKLFNAHRDRFYHLLTAIDCAHPYEPVDAPSETYSVFINGTLLDDTDAALLGEAFKRYHLGSINSVLLDVSRFSTAHFRNLLELFAPALIDLLPVPDPEPEDYDM